MKRINDVIPYKNGKISIQASEVHYCCPEKGMVQVSVFDKDDNFIKENLFKEYSNYDGTTIVYGYVPVELVEKALIADGHDREEVLKIFKDFKTQKEL